MADEDDDVFDDISEPRRRAWEDEYIQVSV